MHTGIVRLRGLWSKRFERPVRFTRHGTAGGWHFLTGDEASIRALTQTVGFHYMYDPQSDQYAHASGVSVLTPACNCAGVTLSGWA